MLCWQMLRSVEVCCICGSSSKIGTQASSRWLVAFYTWGRKEKKRERKKIMKLKLKKIHLGEGFIGKTRIWWDVSPCCIGKIERVSNILTHKFIQYYMKCFNLVEKLVNYWFANDANIFYTLLIFSVWTLFYLFWCNFFSIWINVFVTLRMKQQLF